MAVISSLFYFIVALALLITVHEFGHFWVARRLGVKVLRFSIGFGRPLFSWQRDGVEYVIAMIPLGGYVKMLDEREGEVAADELDQAFNRQPLGSRFSIVLAGPLFNFIFAVLLYWIVFIIGIPGLKPVIGEVEPSSPAYFAGFQAGDEIVAIDTEETATWQAVMISLLGHSMDAETVDVKVFDEDRRSLVRPLDMRQVSIDELSKDNVLTQLGIVPYSPKIPPVLGELEKGGVAEKAGFLSGDRILSANGQPIDDWSEWVVFVQQHPDQDIVVELQRDGVILTKTVRPERVAGGVGRIGVGVSVPEGLFSDMERVISYNPAAALWKATVKTWDMTALTLQMLAKMVIGEVSLDNISGPISIAQYAGYSADVGLISFLMFLAIISISLAVLNLLPIPILDGGHLLFYIIEFFKGSPLSDEAQLFGQKLGMALLISLMFLAFYNDIERLLG